MLDGLLPLVLLPLSVDLFGLFWSGLLHLPLPLSETGLDTSLPLQLSLLIDVHALWTMTHVVCGQFRLLCDVDNEDYAQSSGDALTCFYSSGMYCLHGKNKLLSSQKLL